MPIYEFQCVRCGAVKTFIVPHEAVPEICPYCGLGRLRRVMSSNVGLKFKGPGFYATDYRKEKKQ